MNPFYVDVLRELIRKKMMNSDAELLVLCGGEEDKEALLKAGFKNAIISGLDEGMNGTETGPYGCSLQDAENLTFEDGRFDFCIVHFGLHHCHSPHRALLEMYRVAKKGVLLFEPYECSLSRLGRCLRLGQDYEHAAVFHNKGIRGGVGNSCIPNYVYRWSRREIIKTISAYAPYGVHRFEFYYNTRMPWAQLRARKNKAFFYAALLAGPFLKMLHRIWPAQANNFAVLVMKPDLCRDLHPWLCFQRNKVDLNGSWLNERYEQ